jgi:phage protein D/phage baseplate assembly protein gpV
MPNDVLTSQNPAITSEGTPLPPAVHTRLLDLEIESTYNRPDCCLLTFDIDAKTELPPSLELGKALAVGFRGDGGSTQKAFEGEITALEWDSTGERTVFIVQAEDKFHRLFRGDRIQTFVDSTVSDAVSKTIRAAGLPTDRVEPTTSVLPFLMQQNVSDGVFLLERAAEHGCHVRCNAGKIFWGKVGSGGDSGVTLERNSHLLSFNCRASANAFVKEVAVHGWDPVAKAKIDVKVTAFNGHKDDKFAKSGLNDPKVLLARSDVGSAAEAKLTAQAALDRANEPNRQAEGRCFGDVRLAVDKDVTIKGVNTRFDGKYRISRLRHRYSHDEGFTTEFSCRGASDQSLAGLVTESAASAAAPSGPDRSVFDGVTVGMVTDLNDPEDLGRVKVKLPTLDDVAGATHWLRVVFPGAGSNDQGGASSTHHGLYALPDVDDEVLVVFEQGDARRGYVLGGLLGGKAKPAYAKGTAIESGRVNQRALRTRSGAHLLLDEKKGKEVIELKNKDGCFTLKFSEEKGVEIKHSVQKNVFTISNNGDITITSEQGNVTIETKMGDLTLKSGKNLVLEAKANIDLKATANLTAEGAMTTVKGKTMGTFDGGAQAIVKGGMVMIN